MATKTFNVSGCSDGACIISENGNATVNANDYVQWNKTGNTLTSFSIAQVSGTGESQIWQSLPAPYPNANSSNWRGQIGNVGSVYEDYTITCVCGSNKVSHDPRISVNPKTKKDAV